MIRRIMILLAVLASGFLAAGGATATQADTSLIGAGSTFVAPLVALWTPEVAKAYGIKVTYGAVGSGAGINSITSRVVDFGASDAPMSPSQFSACKGCVQVPWALGATAIMYNVRGVPNHLRLSGKAIAGIFMGSIKRWNDPAIQKLNKGVKLPSTGIVPIHRSDNSGTTYNLTDYLSSVNTSWRSQIGRGVAVNWPGGLAGKGSSGVSAVLKQTDGGVAYADIAYALKNHFNFAAVQNRAGKFLLPGIRSIEAAAKTIVRVAPNNSGISIVNPAKSQKTAYPIATFTYVILPEKTSKAKTLRTFVYWALTHGQSVGAPLFFAPIPLVVLRASLKTLTLIHT